MLFYGFAILITILIAWLYSNSPKAYKKILFFLLIAFPALVSGLRGVGADYMLHRVNYSRIIGGNYYLIDYTSILMQFEKILGEHGYPFQLTIFITSIATVAISFWSIKLFEEDINFTYAVFSYMLQFYLLSFNLYRQMLAVALFTFAVALKAKKNSRLFFWIIGILAGLVHSTAFLWLLIYFVWNFITKAGYFKERIFIYCLGVLFVFSIPIIVDNSDFLRVIFPHYENYFREFKYLGIGLGIIRYIVLAIIPAFYNRFIDRKKTIYQTSMSYLPFFSVFGTLLSYLSYVSDTFAYRISFYFLSSLAVYHGYLYKKYRGHGHKINKGFIWVLAGAIVLLLFFIYDIAFSETGKLIPYKVFWK